MLAYHGSNSCFRKLRIHKDLVRSNASELNEGFGIYFSTDRDVAAFYGKYLYILEINDDYIRDFRLKTICRKYVSDIIRYIYNKERVDISNYFNTLDLIDYMRFGNIAITGTGREIQLLLDSSEYFYNLSNSKVNNIFKLLDSYDRKNLKVYMFNYHIKNIGIIKNTDENIVRIISRDILN